MNRREFLGAGAAAAVIPKALKALTFNRRVIVIGYDGLGVDDAHALIQSGAPALSRIDKLYCNLSLGQSATQPGWHSMMAGIPAIEFQGVLYGAVGNTLYRGIPQSMHVYERLMMENPDLYCGWVSGKGTNVRGNIPQSPHYGVYDQIVNKGHLGQYHGDILRSNADVFDLAGQCLAEAGSGPLIGFFLFHDPDHVGHVTRSYASYMNAAVEVDGYAEQLIQQAKADDPNTVVILVSDHRFGFTEKGDVETGHLFQDRGFLGFDVPTSGIGDSEFSLNETSFTLPVVNQATVARVVYRLFGGNPDDMHQLGTALRYRMYGIEPKIL